MTVFKTLMCKLCYKLLFTSSKDYTNTAIAG